MPDILPDVNQTWTIITDFQEVPNIKFHRNPSSGRGTDICERSDLAKLIEKFRDYAKSAQ